MNLEQKFEQFSTKILAINTKIPKGLSKFSKLDTNFDTTHDTLKSKHLTQTSHFTQDLNQTKMQKD